MRDRAPEWLLAPAVCLLVRWPLWSVLGDSVPHMTFFPAVVIATYFGAIAANYFLTEQFRAFRFTNANDIGRWPSRAGIIVADHCRCRWPSSCEN